MTATSKPSVPGVEERNSLVVKKRKREVQVVTAASAFPISTKPPRQPIVRPERPSKSQKRDKSFLDWHETAKEVRNFGATAFVGQQKRNFESEQYKQLTGRDKKQQRIPLPIVRGIKKKAAQREARQLQEAKEAGIILPVAAKKEKEKDKSSLQHGPAPSIGFVSGKGILKLKKKPF
jgi:hypothetical protein